MESFFEFEDKCQRVKKGEDQWSEKELKDALAIMARWTIAIPSSLGGQYRRRLIQVARDNNDFFLSTLMTMADSQASPAGVNLMQQVIEALYVPGDSIVKRPQEAIQVIQDTELTELVSAAMEPPGQLPDPMEYEPLVTDFEELLGAAGVLVYVLERLDNRGMMTTLQFLMRGRVDEDFEWLDHPGLYITQLFIQRLGAEHYLTRKIILGLAQGSVKLAALEVGEVVGRLALVARGEDWRAEAVIPEFMNTHKYADPAFAETLVSQELANTIHRFRACDGIHHAYKCIEDGYEFNSQFRGQPYRVIYRGKGDDQEVEVYLGNDRIGDTGDWITDDELEDTLALDWMLAVSSPAFSRPGCEWRFSAESTSDDKIIVGPDEIETIRVCTESYEIDTGFSMEIDGELLIVTIDGSQHEVPIDTDYVSSLRSEFDDDHGIWYNLAPLGFI